MPFVKIRKLNWVSFCCSKVNMAETGDPWLRMCQRCHYDYCNTNFFFKILVPMCAFVSVSCFHRNGFNDPEWKLQWEPK